MRPVLLVRAVGFGLLLALGAAVSAPAGQSLGDVAAREKAKREKERAAPKPPRVYTQEDLDKLEGAGRPNSAAASSTGSSPSAPESPQNPSPPASSGGGQESTEGPETSGSTLGGEREKNLDEADPWRERHRQALAAVESAR